MRHSTDLNDLAGALARAQAKMKPAAKSGTNTHFKSRFSTLQDVWEAAAPALAEHGLSVAQSTDAQDDGGFTVVTMLLHASGQWMRGDVRVPLAKADAQAMGSAISYGRRYGLAAMLGIVADEDDDGNAATAAAPARQDPARQDPPRQSAPPARTNGGSGKPEDKVFPFGRNKDKRLGDFTDEELRAAIDWCSEDDQKKEKFANLIAALSKVLGAREMDLEEVGDDGLPF